MCWIMPFKYCCCLLLGWQLHFLRTFLPWYFSWFLFSKICCYLPCQWRLVCLSSCLHLYFSWFYVVILSQPVNDMFILYTSGNLVYLSLPLDGKFPDFIRYLLIEFLYSKDGPSLMCWFMPFKYYCSLLLDWHLHFLSTYLN